jgi:MFS family permease
MQEGKAIGRFGFLTYFGHGVYDSMLVLFLLGQGWSKAEIALLIPISALTGIVIGPAWSMLADEVNKHKLILTISMIGMATCILVQSFSPPHALFWAATVLMYIFGASVSPITTGLTASYSARTEGNYGKLKSYGPIGYGIGALLIGVVSQFTGLIIICYTFALILIGCVFVLRWFPTEAKRDDPVWTKQTVHTLFNRKTIGFWITVILVTGPLQSFLSTFGLLYTSAGGNAADIGYATMFGYLIEWIALRYRQQLFKKFNQNMITCSVVLVLGVSWFAIYLLQGTVTFWFAFAGHGVGIALLISTFDLQMSKIGGEKLTSSSIGVLYSMISVAMFACTALSSFAIKLTGDDYITALLFGIITIGGLFAMVRMYTKTKTNASEKSPTLEPELPMQTKRTVNKPALLVGAVVMIGLLVIVKTKNTHKMMS